MNPLATERLTALWLSDFDKVRGNVRKSVRSWELAEDITMQAFAEVGEALDKNPSMNLTGGFVQTVADRRAMNHWRSQKAMKDALGQPVQLDEERDEEYLQYHPYEEPGFAEGFDEAVRSLPKAERDVFILTELRGLSVEDAAAVVGASRRMAYYRASAANTKIKEAIAA